MPTRAMRCGFRSVSAAERAGFGMLTSVSTTIVMARAINYVRERRRRMPRVRSWGRVLTYRVLRRNELRVHHSVPGLGISLIAGACAILAHEDARGFWLSLPFGTGTGLALDEVALLVERDNPYWGSERIALAEAALAAGAAAGMAAHFQRRGAREVERSRFMETDATRGGARIGFEIPRTKETDGRASAGRQ